MPASVEKLSGEPIIVYHYTDPLTEEEVLAALGEAEALCREHPGHLHLIHNASALNLNFSQLVQTLIMFTGNVPAIFAEEPDRFTYYMAGASGIIKMAAQAAGQRQYGSFNMRFVGDNLDEVLDFIRAEG